MFFVAVSPNIFAWLASQTPSYCHHYIVSLVAFSKKRSLNDKKSNNEAYMFKRNHTYDAQNSMFIKQHPNPRPAYVDLGTLWPVLTFMWTSLAIFVAIKQIF